MTFGTSTYFWPCYFIYTPILAVPQRYLTQDTPLNHSSLKHLARGLARTGGWASDGCSPFPGCWQGLREQAEEVVEVASANEGMTGAAVDLGKEMFKGTILADVAGQALPLLAGVLTIAKEFPFLGPIVAVLNALKGMVEKYQAAEEECRRLVVCCVALNPTP